jgi:hypothetical protein
MFRHLLSAQLKLWHLLLVVVLLAVGSASTSAGQTATPTRGDPNLSTDSFFRSGVFNMAAAQSQASQVVHSVDGMVEVLRASFTVPAGQQADIAAFFSGEAYKYPNGYCYLKFFVDQIGSAYLLPGRVWVADGYIYSGAYPTITAQGYKVGVGAGEHSVVVALLTTGGDCYVDSRSLIVISNRHY